MDNKKNEPMLIDDLIISKIYLIRGLKVMLDGDLAELYGTETKKLKQQVKRNLNRFPSHYMFKLTQEEYDSLRSQNVTLKRGEHSKYLPYVFTEHGVLMLSNVLKSAIAIDVSIRIIDVFVKLRETLADQSELWLQIERIKGKLNNQDKNMEIVFRYLDELIEQRETLKPRKRMGYKPDDEL
ncbi:ORF6N domain-containing protein [Mucilaginibacter sp. 21P]|uniref:ORF6N domain-containing protein n=1 Tax=Mucilaginibacter sp. 21P TaxID=2778902 RepID=UPI001C5911EF|nr:ORF6N domain-containing protein [Mucilaginibacter sp. 21P]QXV65985.1 ORF6N domain-containing protein [Mucilaginibacter sp. 21P]